MEMELKGILLLDDDTGYRFKLLSVMQNPRYLCGNEVAEVKRLNITFRRYTRAEAISIDRLYDRALAPGHHPQPIEFWNGV